jgi:outer membrane protein TolC
LNIETAGGNLPVYDGNPANLLTATQFAYFPSSTMSLLKKGTFGSLSVVQPVFAGGRIYNGNQLASLGEQVNELQEKLAADEINLKVEEQYRLIVALAEKQKTILKYEALLAKLIDQVNSAYSSGLVLRNDVLKVKLKQSEVQLNKSKLENGKKIATMAFCQYIGFPYDSTIVLDDTISVKEIPQSYFVDHHDALERRTEYALLKLSVSAEELQTKMKTGEFLPQAGVGLAGLYMKMDETESRTIGTVFGTVSVPISGWWGGSYEIQERHIREEIATNNLKDKSELLLLQMEKAWQDVTDAYKQLQLSEEARAQAEVNVQLNEESYKNGLSTVSDLLEAQAMHQQTLDQLIDAKAGYANKVSVYLQITGRR